MRVEQEMKMKTKIIPSLTKRSSGIFPTGAVFARFCLQCVLCGEKFERPRPGRCVVASVFFSFSPSTLFSARPFSPLVPPRFPSWPPIPFATLVPPHLA